MRMQRGVTLIELIASITVLAVAGTALFGTLGYLSGVSGETFTQAQAQAIANSYLSEALAKPFLDPAGPDNETQRANFDDVDDYNGIDDANATDRFGNVIAPLRVRVTVGNGALAGIPAARVRRVDVRVDLPNGNFALASGYRTRYP